ncbi:hypothetical protein BOSE62_140045 [Bosea sp. 62]|nr:hypothetical protein BOSE7B_150046 [Bosea sp. 7B]CAD5271591.1 hypothetical protein BOSE21B_20022 [Bosea sp. 21B]CAD5273772.1 hypothetical protein BOSE46_20319 [Bosea sp. 46]VVT56201.1 hypothetical protein BOS5A_140022 [Bosea sp. EC-HK365B]VXB63404.1 hypothetical protein BOSE62_140045 [Bosea sp. 62]VXC06752.1 hypothetical protein BOSE29B_20020 [Bosea sp. 29B]VXC29045.1 hypothetical protein BOSE127_180046 [Bosea sp. 127]VXC61184.1 hypothetical protein BOSE125_30335 [Bosea sp. 125]
MSLTLAELPLPQMAHSRQWEGPLSGRLASVIMRGSCSGGRDLRNASFRAHRSFAFRRVRYA